MLRDLIHVLLVRDYNTALVVGSTAMLGAAAGLVGSFLLLRKRALMGDALSHATLPGICLAFIVMSAAGVGGKALPLLIVGALVSGLAGVGSVLLIRNLTRLRDDAAMGIVLSVFFGLGIALIGVIQRMSTGGQAGLESFIYGKAASVVKDDLILILAVCGGAVLACVLLFKELMILCFDEDFAGAQGWPVLALDIVLLALLTAVTVVGLQAVGLILIIALLIIPAAAARFWTERLRTMLIIAAIIGALGGWLGSSLSALYSNMPAGAVIVLVCSSIFVVSMFIGPARGILVRAFEQWRLSRAVGRQHLLRAIYEAREARDALGTRTFDIQEILSARSWSPAKLRTLIRRAERDDLIERDAMGALSLTERGFEEAARTVRNHRLWEMYLITHADIAPSHVDRDADQIEHVLAPDLIARLERALEEEALRDEVPPSPHVLAPRGAT